MNEELEKQIVSIVQKTIQLLPDPHETNYWSAHFSNVEHVLLNAMLEELYEVTGETINPETLEIRMISKEDFEKSFKPFLAVCLIVFKKFIKEAAGSDD